ncbi:MAG: hypothetical protein AB2L24_19665 [Mangrovibacterium sp.]
MDPFCPVGRGIRIGLIVGNSEKDVRLSFFDGGSGVLTSACQPSGKGCCGNPFQGVTGNRYHGVSGLVIPVQTAPRF